MQGALNAAVFLPSAQQAWTELDEQVFRVGRNGIPQFSHELIADVVRTRGSWANLCQFFDPFQTRRWFVETYGERVKTQRQSVQNQ